MKYKFALPTFDPKDQHVTWSDSYSMGIPEIDEQHKGLFNLVNDLFSHTTGNADEEHAYFKGVIQQAVEYIKIHFTTEEKYMIATKFPGYAEHKKAHDEFVLTIIKTVKDYEAGKRLTLEKLAHFLKDGVLSHVAVLDLQYAHYFKEIARHKADGKPSITAMDLARMGA